MRKKLAGIHLLAPLSESEITDLSRNLDRELIINTSTVTDAIVDVHDKTKYIVTFEYDVTLDGGENQIRRSIPTLELLSYTGENMSGAHWVNVEDMDYHYITPGASVQQAFEELDEQLSKASGLKYIIDGTGTGTLVSSLDGKTSSVTVDAGEYIIVLGESHTASNTEHSVILGGIGSDISASFGSMSRYNLIAASVNGRIQGNNSSMSVYGGIDNYIIGDSAVGNTIVNGRGNLVYGAIRESTIINGSANIISISSKYGYADSVIESNHGYILDSEYSSIAHSAGVTIMNSRYASVMQSAYIEINNSHNTLINSSAWCSILDSVMVNIINSVTNGTQLATYRSGFSNIQNSQTSRIWHSTYSSIFCSSNSTIGCNGVTAGMSSISKTNTSLIFSDVSAFTLGQSVMLIGAEYTSKTNTYQIADIDTVNKAIRFVNESYTYITFNTSSTDSISMTPLINMYTPATIISNTTDTIVLNGTIYTNAYYATIDGDIHKYTFYDALGSSQSPSTIKLRIYENGLNVTNLTPHALIGKTIRPYSSANTSVYNSIILGGIDNNILSGGHIAIIAGMKNNVSSGGSALISASHVNTVTSFNKVVLLGSDYNDVLGSGFASIIGSYDNYIHNTTQVVLLGAHNAHIESTSHNAMITTGNNSILNAAEYSAIIGGGYNYIDGFDNVSMIACNYTTANRPNVLMTPSLTLVGKTLELNGLTPSIGDTLVVESINGKVATLKWGASASSNANSLLQATTYTMWGESVISHAYISLAPDDVSTDVSNDMAVDLTTTGMIHTDYMGPWDSNYIAASNDGITIEDGYKHVISIDSFDAKWVNASASAPIVSMSAPKITITESNNIVTYTTTGGSGTLLDNDETSGCITVNNFTASGSEEAQLYLFIHRRTVNDPAIVTFSTTDIKESNKYAEGITTPIYINAEGFADVYWPNNYTLPIAGEYAWFKSPEAQISMNTYSFRAIVSVNTSTRLVRINGNSILRVNSVFNCDLWYMKEIPRFRVTANISVLKISNDISI